MAQPLKLLLVEDNPHDAELVLRELRRAGYEPDWRRVETPADYSNNLHDGLDIIISDFAMPEFDGLRALDILRSSGLVVPFIIVSGTIGEETAVAAIKQGASDYLLKDRMARLGPAVARALQEAKLLGERQAAALALARAEGKYRGLFENSLEGIYQTTPDGRLTAANPALARIAGYDSPREMIATIKNLASEIYVHADDRARFKKLMAEAGVVRKFEAQMRRRDGSLFWISSNAWATRDAEGQLRYEGLLEDITERRLAEQKIREQLGELLRWQEVMLNREDRVQALKAEVDDLRAAQGLPARYRGTTQGR